MVVLISVLLVCELLSIKRSNCYMVWGGEFGSNTQQARFSQEDLVIGCLVDLATGLMTFTGNGKEINTFFQVSMSTLRACFHCISSRMFYLTCLGSLL